MEGFNVTSRDYVRSPQAPPNLIGQLLSSRSSRDNIEDDNRQKTLQTRRRTFPINAGTKLR